jgi:hypothetical protein
MSANDKQIAGKHYKMAIEPWDAITAWELGYLDGSAVKYLSRWRKKNGVEDVMKAIHFLEKLVEVENDRLQRTQAKNAPARQGYAQTTLATEGYRSAREGISDHGRAEATDKCNQRSYIPTSLGDII